MVEASRPATAADIPRIVELARLARAELAALRGGVLWAAREAWPEPLDDAYGALRRRDDALLVVGTIDDEFHYVILDFVVTALDPAQGPVAGDDAAEAAWVPIAGVADVRLVGGLYDFLRDHGALDGEVR